MKSPGSYCRVDDSAAAVCHTVGDGSAAAAVGHAVGGGSAAAVGYAVGDGCAAAVEHAEGGGSAAAVEHAVGDGFALEVEHGVGDDCAAAAAAVDRSVGAGSAAGEIMYAVATVALTRSSGIPRSNILRSIYIYYIHILIHLSQRKNRSHVGACAGGFVSTISEPPQYQEP